MDTVVCLNGIAALQNQDSFFRDVQRVLRPGGTFVFIEKRESLPGHLPRCVMCCRNAFTCRVLPPD